MTENKGDLISREALIKTLEEMADNEWNQQVGSSKGLEDAIDVIEYAPTVLFPLTVKIKDNVTDEDKEVLKRLMEEYKPQILNLETERPQGDLISREGFRKHFCGVNCGKDNEGVNCDGCVFIDELKAFKSDMGGANNG